MLRGLVIVLLLGVTGCAAKPVDMYSWGSYEDLLLASMTAPDTVESELLVNSMESDRGAALSQGKALPPGWHAHLALLHEEVGRRDLALTALQEEKALYPESEVFVEWLLGNLLVSESDEEATPPDVAAVQPDEESAPPRSVLILPPINQSMVLHATYSYLSTLTHPFVEHGYYVLPVELVYRILQDNGLPDPQDMHDIPLHRAREVFGADTILYVDIAEYGSSYRVVYQSSKVLARMRLVDTRTGEVLWTATAKESFANYSFSLADTLISAAIGQISSNFRDDAHKLSRIASRKAVTASGTGLSFGPRHARAGEAP